MSRIGKQPVAVPNGVKAQVSGDTVTVEGPEGKLQLRVDGGVKVHLEGGKLIVEPPGKGPEHRAKWGTVRAHLHNMVRGVSGGFSKSLELSGVGYAASMQGDVLVLKTGYSHPVKLKIPAIVKCKVEKTAIQLKSPDRHVVGQFAAQIRNVSPPEPYLGKGIKYSDEVVRRKAGKTGK